MAIFVISFWLPLLWALFVGISWKFMWKEPINHWIVCAIVGALCFFWFGITVIGFLVALAIRFKIFNSLMRSSDKKDKEDERK